MEEISRLDNSAEERSWIRQELDTLKNQTTFLTVVVFSVLGVLLSYYVLNISTSSVFQNVVYSAVDDMGLVVSWETSVPTKTKVEYGTSQIYMNETVLGSSFDTTHDANVTGLLPKKEHYFRLVAEDTSGNTHISPFYKLN